MFFWLLVQYYEDGQLDTTSATAAHHPNLCQPAVQSSYRLYFFGQSQSGQVRHYIFTGSLLWIYAFLGCFVGYTRGGLSQSHELYQFISFPRIFTVWLIVKRWTPENGEMNLEVGIVLIIDVNMNNSLRPSNLYRKQGLYFIHNLKQSRSLKDKIDLFAKNCNQCCVNLKGTKTLPMQRI